MTPPEVVSSSRLFDGKVFDVDRDVLLATLVALIVIPFVQSQLED